MNEIEYFRVKKMKKTILFVLFYLSFTASAQESINIPTNVPANGLLAYYPFTGNANDNSGNGNNGITSDVTLTTDRFGVNNNAYSFNGISSNIESNITNYPLKGESRTITGWFKANAPITSKELDFCLLNYGNIADPNYWFKISFYSKGYLDLQFDSNTFQSQENYFNNEWTFFAMTFDDASNTYSLYINGIYKMGGTADLYTNGFNTLFRIGRNKLNNYFEGTIDDIGIWNRVLTPGEITALYNSANNDLYTLIPDSNFEQKLIDLGIDSGAVDGRVLTSKINTVNFLNVNNSNISDLTGIQDFVSLTDLHCSQNALTTLNVSKNTALTTLACNNNRLIALDVSNNVALIDLVCYTNQLTTLDVKVNTALVKLDSGSNKYTSLDVNTNTALTFLGCNTSQLTTLDVSRNTALTLLDCRENKLTSLNVSANTALGFLDCSTNQLSTLNVSTNTALYGLYCSTNQLTSLNVSTNTTLNRLGCFSNQLTVLDISNNTALNYLNCKINKLKTLDTNKNIALNNLYCHQNQISILDLSKNTTLTTLNCSGNQLTILNLKNGNNNNFDPSTNINAYINFTNNPNLTCIQVDDKVYADSNWPTQKDATASYDTNCTSYFTEIPDSNFEQKLIDLGIDTDGLNGKITITNINLITSLDLSNSNITDLTGIQYFTSLTELYCNGNKLTAIDISKNKQLILFNCSNNAISTLDISLNTVLTTIIVEFNPIISLNLKNGNNKNFIVPSKTNKTTKTLGTVFSSFTNNPNLACIQVDDAIYSNANWSGIKDSTAKYASTCSSLSTTDVVFENLSVYPNPTKDLLHLDNIVLEKVTIYDTLGHLVKTKTFIATSNQNTVDLSGLAKGIYYAYLFSDGVTSVRKIIVN